MMTERARILAFILIIFPAIIVTSTVLRWIVYEHA